MVAQPDTYPAPRLRMTAWMLSSRETVSPEVIGELRAGMFRRMDSLVASALAGAIIMVIATLRHPTAPFLILLATDLMLLGLRVVLVVVLMRRMARPGGNQTSDTWLVDLFLFAGILWCVQTGLSAGLCMTTDDQSLCVLSSLFATGTMGALCARNPGAPRVVILQIALIVLPFSIGAWMSPEPLLAVVAVIAPLYMLSMVSINRQLHADYVEMIVARFETRRRALHCALTGLPNRAYFEEALREATDHAKAGGRPVSLMGLDLDGFKVVNDTFGHPTGDRLLGQVADRLRSLTAPGAMTARLGGDEFAILMRSGSDAEVDAMAITAIETIGRPYFLPGAGSVTIGVSIGIAMGDDAELLVAQADSALYEAKRAGRGTFSRHWAEDAVAARSLRDIALRMRAA